MPVISVTLLPGYPQDAQQRLVQRLAHTARSVIDASDAGTTVLYKKSVLTAAMAMSFLAAALCCPRPANWWPNFWTAWRPET